MKPLAIISICLLTAFAAVGLAQVASKPAATASKPAVKAEPGKAFVENWNWPRQMLPYAKKFKGTEGVVVQFGDSMTYSAPSTAWARYFANDPDHGGYTDADKEILKWSHANEPEKDTDGWWLAYVDRPDNRSETAAGGLATSDVIKGGFNGLPSLADILKKYNPQVAILQFSYNDLRERKPEDIAKDMGAIIDALLANGTVPVLMTMPPHKEWHDKVKALNAKYRELANDKQIPLIDYYAEITALRPGDAWQGTLVGDDNFPTANTLQGPPTVENLSNSGYLLRCWLTVQKLKEIKAKVIDKK